MLTYIHSQGKYDGSTEEDSLSSSCQGLEDICTRTYASIHVDLLTTRYGFHNFREHINLQRSVIDVKNRASHPASIIIIISGISRPSLCNAFKDVGCFINVSRALQNIHSTLQKSYLLWEFHAEILYVCPMPCFGNTYKVSAWNSPHRCDFWHYIFSRDYLGELAKRYGNYPLTHADRCPIFKWDITTFLHGGVSG